MKDVPDPLDPEPDVIDPGRFGVAWGREKMTAYGDARVRAALEKATKVIEQEVLLCDADVKHDNEHAAKIGEGAAFNLGVTHCAAAIRRLLK